MFVHPLAVLIWVLAAWFIAILGRKKRFGFTGNFLVALIFSPIVGVIVLLASDDRVQIEDRRSERT